MIDCILDAISLQIESLELLNVRREDIIIDLSSDLYNAMENKYRSMLVVKEKDDNVQTLYGCEINVMVHAPKNYFKVSKKESVILNFKNQNYQTGFYCSKCGSSLGIHIYGFCPCCGSRLARFHYENL